ncbi:MAG: Gfo/Idh/MocA family oxidoreductase [Acidobacteriia bacterium]|nr:Gfo/Idh/MocA family oxidoreductase [Terriglobia bacterium]
MSGKFSRRHFFYGTLLAGVVPAGGFGSTPSLKMLGYKSPNEKLNIASIGAGGKAYSDIRACAQTENIVALCDVDDKQASFIYKQFDKPPRYKDFRKMLDKEAASIDAVIVAIPDHMHATAAMHAMERGKHVYVQKPLAHTIWECRQLTEAAARYKVATQMGNQGYSNQGTRQCAEMIWAGEIGNVTEVHAWSDRPIWPQGLTAIPPETPVPSTLDWDLWLGIAAARPFTAGGAGYPAGFADGGFYLPANWRGFYDFGCGALGDMACHILGAPNLALKLGAPTSVECVSKEGVSGFMFPKKSVIKFEFPARGSMPPVKLFWYDALTEQPKIPGVPEGEYLGDLPAPSRAPAEAAGAGGRRGGRGSGGDEAPRTETTGRVFNWAQIEWLRENPPTRPAVPNGSLFIGDKGMITTGTYGEVTRHLPVEKMKDYSFPQEVLTRSPGHYHDWIRAAKGGEPACSNFSVAGSFTEWIALGVVSLHFEGKLEWDPIKMKITNNAEANKYIKPTFRKGWSFT